MSVQLNAANYTFKQVSIEGRREVEAFSYSKISTGVDKIMDVFTDSASNLSKMEQGELRAGLELLAIEKIQAKDQANIRMNKPPEERVHVNKTDRTHIGADIPEMRMLPKYIYERDSKTFENDTERAEWQPRIKMLEQAFEERSIFAISIIPYDPGTHQTWYDKKSVCQTVPIPVDDQELIAHFGFLPPDDEGPCIREESRIKTTLSNAKADNTNPPEVLTGFFLPYPTFSSEVAAAQIDPENLPLSVTKASVFSEEQIGKSLSEINNVQLHEKIKNIISLFLDDVHAKGLGLTILQPPMGKKLYFIKDISAWKK